MRYTTIVDISELHGIYRNHNARIIYLHMCLKSGWHDQDRDIIDISIRTLAMATGLTVSATRHALAQLERAGLISRQGTVWSVKKFIFDEQPTPRAKTRNQQKTQEVAAERRRNDQRREQERDLDRQQRARDFSQGKSSFMIWYEGKMREAAAGDIDAQRTVDRNRTAYEQQLKMMNEQKKQKV